MVFFLPHEIHKKLPTKNPPKGGGYFFVGAIYYVGLGPAKKQLFFAAALLYSVISLEICFLISSSFCSASDFAIFISHWTNR